jgi:hypothetical protein
MSFSIAASSLFSASNIVVNFLRFFLINEVYGIEVFTFYTLWLVPFFIYIEYKNLYVDISRSKLDDNFSLGSGRWFSYTLLSLSLIVYVVYDLEYVALILIFISVIDGIILSLTALRSSKKNWIILIIRCFSLLVLIVPKLIILYLFLSYISVLYAYKGVEAESIKAFKKKMYLDKHIFVTALAGRSREFLNILIFQIALQGDQYFLIFMLYKVMFNLAGFVYNTIRSTLKFDTTTLIDNIFYFFLSNKIVISIISLLLLFFGGVYMFIIFLVLENLIMQLYLFSKYSTSNIILKSNIYAVTALVAMIGLYQATSGGINLILFSLSPLFGGMVIMKDLTEQQETNG